MKSTLDAISSVLTTKLWSFPLGIGLLWKAKIVEPLWFVFYLLLLITIFFFWLPLFRHLLLLITSSYVNKMVCCRSVSKTWKLLSFCKCDLNVSLFLVLYKLCIFVFTFLCLVFSLTFSSLVSGPLKSCPYYQF